MPIFFPGSENNETTQVDWDAMTRGAGLTGDNLAHPEWAILTRKTDSTRPRWWSPDARCPSHPDTINCQDYPFRSTHENPTNAALRLVLASQNFSEGGLLGVFYDSCDIVDPAPFLVIPMAWVGAPKTHRVCANGVTWGGS
jgi:hypothetical protein